ncbi:MAG: sensor histidine kinase, partial [Micromonospora sp.]
MDRNRTGWGDDLFDALVALALLAIGLVGTGPAGANEGMSTGRATYPLVVVAALALAVRRRWPLATLAVVTAASTAYLVLGYPYGPILLSFFVAVYTVAAYLPLRTAAVADGVALLALLAHVVVGVRSPGLLGAMPAAA